MISSCVLFGFDRSSPNLALFSGATRSGCSVLLVLVVGLFSGGVFTVGAAVFVESGTGVGFSSVFVHVGDSRGTAELGATLFPFASIFAIGFLAGDSCVALGVA